MGKFYSVRHFEYKKEYAECEMCHSKTDNGIIFETTPDRFSVCGHMTFVCSDCEQKLKNYFTGDSK
jgi:CO dehydrogenase/acetyl-CoA synthase beta subunit